MKTPDLASAAASIDRWADSGRAESMERGHRPATESATSHWQLQTGDVVLDVGCGNGWALRMLVHQGADRGVGIDVSPGMIERARNASDGSRFRFEVADAQALPLKDGEISHVISVEALYYTPDPGAALTEWGRVTRSGGDGHHDRPLCGKSGGSSLDRCTGCTRSLAQHSPTHGHGRGSRMDEYPNFSVYRSQTSEDEAEFEPSRYWPSYEVYRGYMEAGSLMLRATKR